MDEVLRQRLWRHIEALPEEQVYQVLDYIEFLTSKYARHAVRPPASALQQFNERFQDKMRLRGVGVAALRRALETMDAADRVVSGLSEAGRSLVKEVEAGFSESEQRQSEQRRLVSGSADVGERFAQDEGRETEARPES